MKNWTGYALAFVGSFLFATKGIWIKLAYRYGIDASALLSLRLSIAMPFYLLIGLMTWWRARRKGQDALPSPLRRPGLYLQAMAVGALGYWLASYTDFVSLTTLSPQFERLILFTYPLFVILFGALFFGQPLRLKAIWAFAIAYVGLALVFLTDLKTSGSVIAVGVLWCSVSSIAFALYLLLAKPLIRRLGPSLFTSWAMSGAAVVTVSQFFILHHKGGVHLSPPLLYLSLGLAVTATVMPSYLINFALSRISSQANAVIGFVNPVFTLIMSALILTIPVTAADLVGTLLVLAGVGLYLWLDQRAARREA
ncbi:DMT family transporter [Asticcacaulis sp. EMRT-3]|uniref:DMT family transporter n=1 Tax=Asticcacaulis sp. EMRT-3 TaxID=3040349 RepID=UPI0024AF9BCC|nr:DMT family transporter [Asticcacaulis sp. EMRT-3]MDI7774362.1 DMT family transporter [Asticcacaulis sp. EMRT-3]